jgi:hypothetical protein
LSFFFFAPTVSAQDCGITCGGWFGGVDAVIAKPHFEDGRDVDDDEPQFEYVASPRFWLGYQNCEGFGVRSRYWSYRQESSFGDLDGPDGGTTLLRLQSLDVDITQQVCLGPVAANLFGGLKYAKYDHCERERTIPEYSQGFEGLGPTLGLEASLPIYNSGFELLAGCRYSHLFGETATFDDGDPYEPTPDDHGSIFETQLGVQYQCHVGCGGLLAVRALVESQNWAALAEGPQDIGGSGDDDMGLLGFVFGVEYLR